MPDEPPQKQAIGTAGWTAIVVLTGFLLASIAYAVHAWMRMEGTTISTFGWIMLVLGVVVTMACGIGLMALVFYSSRKNFDQ